MNPAHAGKKIHCFTKKIRSTTFLSENLQEDVAVSLEEKSAAVSFLMPQSSGQASTESTGLEEMPERKLPIFIGHRRSCEFSRDVCSALERVVAYRS
ncbi:MAG: hypothetical protein DMG64_10190 [Acidobacteria bacterium]|nr:MAG: hypothetical protein DMG63_09285 [Acidobacteriota bacterium]PYY02838.1 MAG: hypothetical protein DMG64_10190 [Acidobacteriota bacterium]